MIDFLHALWPFVGAAVAGALIAFVGLYFLGRNFGIEVRTPEERTLIDRLAPLSAEWTPNYYTIIEDGDGDLHGFPVGKPCAVCAGPHDAARWPERPERDRVRVQRKAAS